MAGPDHDVYELLLKGLELLESGEPARAVPLLEKASAAEPFKSSILEPLGRAYYRTGDHAGASRCFEKVVELYPANDYAHYCLGLCCLKLDRKSSAAAHFKMAWSLRPLPDYREKASRFGADTLEAGFGGG